MRKVLAALTSCILYSSTASAQEFFGKTDLDYWREGPRAMSIDLYKNSSSKAASPDHRPPPVPTGSLIRQQDAEEFHWEDYNDPNSAVFWDDGGDYIPPRPMRVTAANPTPENVGNYLGWVKRKLEVITRFDEAVAKQQEEPKLAPLKSHEKSTSRPVQWNEADIVFFYSSTCPHCRASVETVKLLRGHGARVIPVQLDWEANPPLLQGSVPYKEAIAKAHPVESVPSWVVTYRSKTIEKKGEVTLLELEAAL